MNIQIKKPSECTKEEIKNFYKLVLKGAQVKKSGLEWRIKRGKLLALCYEKNILAGTLGIKQLIKTYKKKIFRKAGVPEEADNYEFELGWAYILPKYRGRGFFSFLNKKLVSVAGRKGLYATIEAKSLHVQKVLEKNGFKKIGKPYTGRIMGRLIQLFVRKSK